MTDDLKKLGIAFQEPLLVEDYYKSLRGILLSESMLPDRQGMYLDLNSLPSEPIDLKGAVIKWIVHVNLPRLRDGLDPVVTLQLILKCPIWKVVKPPLKKLALSPEGMFNKPKVKTLGQKPRQGSINKR